MKWMRDRRLTTHKKKKRKKASTSASADGHHEHQLIVLIVMQPCQLKQCAGKCLPLPARGSTRKQSLRRLTSGKFSVSFLEGADCIS